MNSTPVVSPYPEFEPERYEITSSPAHRFQPNRREFFKLLGGGIVVVCALNDTSAVQESGGGRRTFSESLPQESPPGCTSGKRAR